MRLKSLLRKSWIRQSIVKQVIFYTLLLLLWQMLVMLRLWPDYIFPSPLNVGMSVINGFRNSTFLVAILVSLKRLLIGYFISIVFGVLLGVAICKFKTVEQTLGNLILGLQTLPSICWLPLALIWFGLNESAIIFVIILGSLFAITIATESGIKGISPLYIKAGKNLGATTRMKMFTGIIIPAALPTLIMGLKQGWSFAWRSLLAGELIFGNLGLGYLLLMGRELNDLNQVVAVMLVIAGISIFIDKVVFKKIESGIKRKWGLGL